MDSERTPVDRAILAFDQALRNVFPSPHAGLTRPSPAAELPNPELSDAERRLAIGLMRVNHVGEVCAQALYHGQALGALNPRVKAALEAAAGEETDHLHWCRSRLEELRGRPSVLNPLWYLGALGLGLGAGRCGDAASLGFVIETERQVEAHLDGHLARLPEADVRSRAIMAQMKLDEARHGASARAAGGRPPPRWVARLMALQAKVMTTIAYWI